MLKVVDVSQDWSRAPQIPTQYFLTTLLVLYKVLTRTQYGPIYIWSIFKEWIRRQTARVIRIQQHVKSWVYVIVAVRSSYSQYLPRS